MNSKNFTILVCSLVLSCACSNKTLISNSAANSNVARINTLKTSTFKQNNVVELLAFIDNYSNLTPEMQKKVFTENNQVLAENKTTC